MGAVRVIGLETREGTVEPVQQRIIRKILSSFSIRVELLELGRDGTAGIQRGSHLADNLL